MVDPIGLSMSLSAAEVKALTGWPDPMVQDYLNIIQRLIDYANALTGLQVADADDQSALAEQAAKAGFAAARMNQLYASHIDLEQVVAGSQSALDRLKALFCENKDQCNGTDSEVDALRGQVAGAIARGRGLGRTQQDGIGEVDALRGMLAAMSARLTRLERTHGWGVYRDTTYTSGAPWTLTGGTSAALPNDAGSNIISYMPPNVGPFYDGSQVTPANVGDYYILTVRLQGEYSGTVPVVQFRVDIGGGTGEIFKELMTFPKGSGTPHHFSIVVPFYSLDTFVANGGTVELESLSGGNVDFWGIEYQINRVFAA